MVAWIEPLNLKYLLMNIFAGSPDIFTAVSFIAIAGLATYFRMMTLTMLLLFVLYTIVFGAYMKGIYYLVILIIGIVVSWWISRPLKN